MTFQEMINDLRWDLARCQYRLHQPKLAIVLFFPGFQAVALYRISRWLDTHRQRHHFWWWPLIALEVIVKRITEIVTGVFISPQAQIGAGLLLPHFGGIYIGNGTVVGRNCDVYQGVTIGYNVSTGQEGGYPTVGDRVFLGSGAKVFGPIQIGNDVAIGANAVINKPAPDHAVVLGVPGKVNSYKGSFGLIRYPGWESDPERQASLQRGQPSN
jgi:serine O-acetyltransferase